MSPEEVKKQEHAPAESIEEPELKVTTLEDLSTNVDASITATSGEFIRSLETAVENSSLPKDVSVALGEIKLDAQATASETKEEIEAVVNGEDHEIYNGLSDPEQLESADIETLHDQAKGLRELQRKFNKAFGEVSGIKDKKQRAAATEQFIQQEDFNPENLTAEQLAQVFTTIKSGGEFGTMIDLYHSSKSEIFRESPITREFLAVALHKEALRLMKENPQEASKVLQESEDVIQELISEGKANGEAYAILGKIYKVKHDKFGEEHSLEQSIDNLDKGYKAGFEFYPGVNLAYNKLTQSVEQGSQESVGQALKIFELANVSAEKAGGRHSNDFWTLATLLETSVVMGQRDIDLLERVMSKGKVDWEISAPIENLKRLGEQLKSVDPKKFEQVIQNVEWAVNSLGQRLSEIQSGTEAKREHVSALPENESDAVKATNLILQKGISYGEITTFVGGNIKYGGQLHDYTVNRWDVNVVRQILKDTGLEDTTNFNEFNQKVDAMIRERYQTEPLEDLHSDEHGEFDEFMKKLNGVMDVEKGDDSRTNIMVDFYLGKGDCRQHAHTKQLFFDAWKTDATNRFMAQAYEALNNKDDATYQDSLAKAKELTRMQMMVFDSVVQSPIETDGMYKARRDKDGNLIKRKDNEKSKVEEHTWNGLMKLDENGVISEFRMVDSFYQNYYKFGGTMEQDGEQQAGVPIDFKEILTEGFNGGKIKTDSGEVEVRLVPTVYAGDRAARVIESGDDLGVPKLRGLMMGKFEGDNRYTPDLSHFFADDTMDSIKSFTKKVREEGVTTKKTLAEAEGHN